MWDKLKKSQRLIIIGYVVLFVSQFFTYGMDSYYYTTTGGGFTLYNEGKVENDGWHYHHWYSGLIMAAVAAAFYKSTYKIGWYWAAFVLCVLLGFGGLLGFASMFIVGYAVRVKYLEIRAVSQSKQRDKITSNS